MSKIKLTIDRSYNDTISYLGDDILVAEALIRLAKLAPVPREYGAEDKDEQKDAGNE